MEVGTPRPHAVRTRVLCDCGQGSRAKCRRQYRSAAICGPAWHRIPDDTLSSVNGRVSGVLQPMFPILNALDMQSIRMASLFSDFIDKLNIVFPFELFDGLDRKWIDRFLVAITDISESGNLISTKEKDEIGGKNDDSELIDRWNNTVTEWTSGQTQNFMGRQETIPYSDAKQLVVSADRLKSLTRQNGATDPFSLMHNYIGRILATTGNEDEVRQYIFPSLYLLFFNGNYSEFLHFLLQSCLLASVLIDPLPLEEDDSVFIHVYINNLKDVDLTNIDLSLDFLRNDPFSPLIQFGIGPSWSSGINNLNGFGVLGPHSSFEIHWSRKIISTTRLTTTAHYQVRYLESHSEIVKHTLLTQLFDYAQISNISSVLSVDGKIAPVEDVHIYWVRAALEEKEGFLVSSLGESEPYYFFRPDSGSIVNVVPLQFISSKVESTKNPYRVKVEAIFKNLESPGFSGSLWASLPLPEIPEQYRLIKIIDRRGSRQRILQPVSWIDQNRTLHIIDSSAAFPVSEITYDLVFANPREMQMPSFEQSIYRVQVMPEAWPSVGSIIANLAAHSPDGHPLTYSLYSPDNEKLFSVDHNTGDLFIESSVPSGDEFCLVLIARDDNGQETRVPVVVNTGGPRKECVLFATDGLSPIIHQSSKTAITTKVQWTSSTIRPITEPSETTDDFMTPPVLSISPDISPETISTTITITPTMSLTTSTLSAIHHMSSIQTTVQTTSILHEEMTTNLPTTEDMEIHTITPDKTLLPMTTTIAITEFSELPLTLTENKITSKTSVETEAPSSTTTWISETQENTDKFPTPPTVQLPNDLETTTTNYIVTNEATVIYSISSDANEPTTEVPITTPPATIIYTVSSESPLWMLTGGTKESLPYQTSTEHLYTVTPDYTLLTTLTMTEPVRTTTEYIYTASEEPKPVTTNESIGLPIVIPTESSQTSFSTVKTMTPSTIRSVLFSSTPYTIVSIPTTKKITEDACVKSGLSIWKLICDLSKTAKQKGF
uniref:Cadherin domain-containing protein n=1 Tax=Heterorhabditis bacteriophora TaxID=37862 RepID=A0A1I7XLC6_HETBA